MKKLIILTLASLFSLSLAAQTLTLMSYNIRTSSANEYDGPNGWELRKAASVKMLRAERPDVVGMQEARPDQDAFFRDNLSDIYDGVSVSRNPDNPVDEACTVWYNKQKFDLVRTNTFWLSETPDVPSKGWDGMYNRIVTYLYLRDKQSDQLFLVFNTHLDHVGVVAREKSLQLIADSAISIGGDTIPMFVMGDLNVTPKARELTPMWKVMKLAQNEAPVSDHGFTFHDWGRDQGKMIDYIFYRNVSPLEFRILHDNYGALYLSDHYPVVATFTREAISPEIYNMVAAHNNAVHQRQDRARDDIRFGFYKSENDSILRTGKRVSVVFYGNSITQIWYELRPQFFNDNGFVGRGIGGQTSSDLLVRMRQDVIDLHPKVVVIMCGVNDIAQNRGTISLDDVMGNIISMCELAKANKIKPVLCSPLPARSFYWNPFVCDAPEQIRQLNAKIYAYAKKQRITYVDYYSLMVDSDGGLKPGLSDDEVHPTHKGYEQMEPIILQTLKKVR